MWRDAIRYALAKKGREIEPDYDGEPADLRGLRTVAVKFIDACIDGEQWAIKEIADRLDGKAVQGIDFTDVDGNQSAVTINYVPVSKDER